MGKFRYNIKTDCIEKFTILSFVLDVRERYIFNIIEYIDEELNLNTAFEWVEKYFTKINKIENKLLNIYNELLRSLNFKTITTKVEILGSKREGLNVGDLYDFEKINKLSKNMLERILI